MSRTVAIVTFDRFNELDSFIALHLFGRVREYGLHAELVAPSESVTSMNGVTLSSVRPLEWSHHADVVLVGSGRGTRDAIGNPSVMRRLAPDPGRQLVGSQCSGALVLHHLGLVGGGPVCTDDGTRRTFDDLGVRVLDQPLLAEGNLAMAGGCFAAQYLAAWVITRTLGWARAREAIEYVAPVGEAPDWVRRAKAALSSGAAAAAKGTASGHEQHEQH